MLCLFHYAFPLAQYSLLSIFPSHLSSSLPFVTLSLSYPLSSHFILFPSPHLPIIFLPSIPSLTTYHIIVIFLPLVGYSVYLNSTPLSNPPFISTPCLSAVRYPLVPLSVSLSPIPSYQLSTLPLSTSALTLSLGSSSEVKERERERRKRERERRKRDRDS